MNRSRRSYLPLTDDDLRRLEVMARQRHAEMAAKRPDWCHTLLAACLAQGAARHRAHGDRGIKDLDVYLFYELPPGQSPSAFPYNRGATSRDFGPSEHGRQAFTDEERRDPSMAQRIRTWERFEGRRVDLLARAIPPHADGPRAAVVSWLEQGQSRRGSTAWHLGQAPVVALRPHFGAVWWPGPDLDVAGQAKGLYDTDR